MDKPTLVDQYPVFLAYVKDLSLQDWGWVALYSVCGIATLWLVKNILIAILRRLGLSHPGLYRHLPRLPWRSVLRVWFSFQAWRERLFRLGSVSSGGFAGAVACMSYLYAPGKIFIGRAYAFGIALLQPLGLNVSRHIMMFAMTGSGKTTLLISILACWQGSVLLVDPKGQITLALALKDKKRRWLVFDPYGITGLPCIGFNVFDVIKEAVSRGGVDAAVLWAQRIAQTLIKTPDGAKTPYFYDIARGLVTGLILHVLTFHREEDHNLPFVRTLIIEGYRVFDPNTGKEDTQGNEAFTLLLEEMRRNPAFEGVIAGAATALLNAGGETLGNIISTLQDQTRWLDVPEIRRRLKHSDLSLADLKRRDDIVLALVAPVLSIREELQACFKLFLNMAAYTFEATKEKKGQCLWVVDEMPSLGHNPIFEVMLPVARSQGITFLGIGQDIEIHKKAYRESWETFIGNADLVFWMGSNHEGTLQYLSGVLGQHTVVEKDRYSGRKFHRQVKVAEADQLRRFLNPNAGRMIITRPGQRALRLANDPYFKALPVWAYDPDPDHKEPLLRRIVRLLLGQRTKQTPSIRHPVSPSKPPLETSDE